MPQDVEMDDNTKAQIAAIKNSYICVCIPKGNYGTDQENNMNLTTFVVIDSCGHYITHISLTSYDRQLPNPLRSLKSL